MQTLDNKTDALFSNSSTSHSTSTITSTVLTRLTKVISYIAWYVHRNFVAVM